MESRIVKIVDQKFLAAALLALVSAPVLAQSGNGRTVESRCTVIDTYG